ncbi:radical SAM protein [Acidobacteria bacterium ACD]|nr:MAG: radical SAM protein [Acidobacteriota bacterium]MCE7957749.1 radical SAM protein [Acidobacteria bacterium ACB2]MDL1950216.1 radical SAM protein [Acidobacteria bacterium ACD]
MCDIWKERSSASLSAADLAALLPDLARLGTERVVLSGGEPLMHPDLFALVRPLREAGLGVTLLSSGLLLGRFAEEIARWVDDVVVSLDGPREAHDAIRRVPRAFEKLAEGVAAVKAAGPAVTVSGRCTVQRGNLPHLRATVAAAREIGLSRISFLAADVTSEAFNRPGGWSDEERAAVLPARADLPALAAEIDALEREQAAAFATGFVAESPEKLRERLLAHFAALLCEGPFPASRCNAPWVSAVVEADGTVRPCFFHSAYGNLRESSLPALLNGERALSFRRSLDVATDPTCLRCTCRLNLR